MHLTARNALAAGCLLAGAALLLQACSMTDVVRPEIDVSSTAALPTASAQLMPSATTPPYTTSAGMTGIVPRPDVYSDPDVYREPDVQSEPGVEPMPGYRAPPVQPAVMPDDEVACRRELRRLGASFRDLPPIQDGGSCGIDYPVELSGLSGGIAMKPAATLTCRMAVAVARWTKQELGPSTRLRYLTGVKAIHQASSYSCRSIAGSSSMSEHSKGNALDISRIELDNGKRIGVRRPGFFRFREKSLLNNVRADACDYFSTVLGPGYNHDHRDHFHFDIANRRGGRKACH
ncbi:MAG: extensin family protein [Mesorhizobium sp.]|nr:extensin family protein [Mesorhizobium sp.]